VDRFHIVSLCLSRSCTPSDLSKEAFVYFVCPTEIPQPPFALKYYSPNRTQSIVFRVLFQSTNKQTNHGGEGGGQISWVGSFSRTKREVLSGTKFDLIWILSVISEFSAIFWQFGIKYLNFGAKMSTTCLFKVNLGEGGGELGTPPLGGFGIGVGEKYSAHRLKNWDAFRPSILQRHISQSSESDPHSFCFV